MCQNYPVRRSYADCSCTGERGWPTVAATETSTMPATISVGSIGEDVKRLQRVLARQLLWNPFGPITGVFDASLETSVKIVQQNNGLVVDGIVGPATWAVLPSYREASPELREGSKGPAVAWLQKALAGDVITVEFTPYIGAIDGIFGPKTDAAVHSKLGAANHQTAFSVTTPGSYG